MATSLHGKNKILKQQVTEEVKTQAHISTGFFIWIQHVEMKNIENVSRLNVQYLLYEISLKK